jgi:hypothetical protein
MTRRLLPSVVVAASLLLGCLVIGCAKWRAAPQLPVNNSMVLDQLVVFSETPLPRNHRLLEELRALRTTVSTKLGLPISDEPIHVYLFPTAEKFEAFFRVNHPNLPRRRAFFVETDTRLSVYAYWGDRVAEDLRHEVVHGYLHAVVPNLPLWLDEGLAEYFEVPRGLAGVNRPHVDQLIARGVDWKPDLIRLEQLTTTGEMTQADYAESWAWTHMLLEGPPEQRQVLRGYLQGLMQSSPPMPLSLSLRQVDPQCQQHLREHLAVLQQVVK